MRKTFIVVGMFALPAILVAQPPVFGPPMDYDPFIGTLPQLAQSDVDEDGDLDIVLSAFNDSKVSWLENVDPAAHQFVRNDISAIGSTVVAPIEIVVGDFMGSRGPDVVAIPNIGDPVGFYRAADVRQPWNRATIPSPFDGNTLAVLGSFIDGAKQQILFYAINGSTTGFTITNVTATNPFTPVVIYAQLSTSAHTLHALTAVDWNHDGHMDVLAIYRDNVAAAKPYSLQLYAGAGDGATFTPSTIADNILSPDGEIIGSSGGTKTFTILAAGDWSGFGRTDAAYVTAGGVQFVKRTGDGNQDVNIFPLGGFAFPASLSNNPPAPRKLFVSDYTRDGHLDLVEACTDRVLVFPQTFPSQTFLPAVTIANGRDYSETLLDDFSESESVDIVHGATVGTGATSNIIVRLEPGIVGALVQNFAAGLDGGQILQPGAKGHLQFRLLNNSFDPHAITVNLHEGAGVALNGTNVIYTGTLAPFQEVDLNVPFHVVETIRAPANVSVALDVVANPAPTIPAAINLGTWGTPDSADTHFYAELENPSYASIPDPGTSGLALPTSRIEGIVSQITIGAVIGHPSIAELSGVLTASNGAEIPVFNQGDIPRSGVVGWEFVVSTPFPSGPAVLKITDHVTGNSGYISLGSVEGYLRRYLGSMTPTVSEIRRVLKVPVTIVAGDLNGDGIYDAGDIVAGQNALKNK
ncbi:hypothetical protein BH09SUM1_BH09SUM1_25670 [soil metagenome]